MSLGLGAGASVVDGRVGGGGVAVRPLRVLAPLLVAVLLGLLVVAGSAWGTVGHVSAGGFGGVSVFEGGPAGVGVGVSGDVFASDPGQFAGQWVDRFDGAGVFSGSWPVDRSVYVSLGAVAVDSAVGGGVYVMAADANTGAVSVLKFGATGVVEHVLDVSGSSLSINYGPLAVDPVDGTVWVTATDSADPNAPAQVVAGFDRVSGALVGSFGGGSGSPDGGFVCVPGGLAADGLGQVYVLDPVAEGCKGRVDRYSSAGVFGATVDGGSRGAPVAVATDPVLGEVYVAESGAQGLQVTHFGVNGASVVQTFSVASVTLPFDGLRGLAVGPDATVYVGDYYESEIERFTAFVGPTVTTNVVSDVTTTSATLNGSIDPGGIQSSYRYEYGFDTNYGQSTDPVDAGSGSGASSAPQALTGLDPNTTYHYRIVGSNNSGSILGEDQSFMTDAAPPQVGGSAVASAITPTGARIHGTVDPNHTATTFHVEYGTTTAYGSATASEDVGDSPAATPVVTALTDLLPGTLYHYRITADNGVGGVPVHGADGTFFTAPGTAAGATAVTSQMATLTGTVNPHGVSTTYHFEYGPTAGLGLSTGEVSAGSGDGELAVSAPVAGLMAGRTYSVQLVATSVDGTVRTGALGSFATVADPVAIGVGAIDVTTSSATLVGSTDTHGLPGSYRFEVASLDGGFAADSVERATPGVNGPQRVTAGFAGLPEGRAFWGRLVAMAEGGAISYSSQFAFATAARSQAVPPPPPARYGCVAPVLKAYDARPKPGESISVTGSDLGVGGSVMLGDRVTTSADWSASGLSVDVPDDASGTLGLRVNCGRVSNTIAVTIAADNTLTVTKHTSSGSTASIVVATKAPGVIRASGSRIKTATVSVSRAGAKTIKVKLNAAGIRALAKSKSRRLKTTVRLRFTPVGAQPATKTVTVTFTRKASR